MVVCVIEGVDGVGKTYHATELAKRLRDRGVNAEYMHFPNYNYKVGQTIQDFLYGKFGDFRDIPCEAQSWIYSIDRLCWQKSLSEEDKNKVFICDRYYTSSAIYQCTNLYWSTIDHQDTDHYEEAMTNTSICRAWRGHGGSSIGEWLWERGFIGSKDYIRNLRDYARFIIDREINGLGIHKADMVVYLTAPEDVSKVQNAKAATESGTVKDTFEKDDDFVHVVNSIGCLAATAEGWNIFDVTKDDELFYKYVIENLQITPMNLI